MCGALGRRGRLLQTNSLPVHNWDWEGLVPSMLNHSLAIKLFILCADVLHHVEVVSSTEATWLLMSWENAIC